MEIEKGNIMVKKLVAVMVASMLIYLLYFWAAAGESRQEELIQEVSARVDEKSIQIDAIMRSVDRQAISVTLDYNIQKYLYREHTDEAADQALKSYLMGLAKTIRSTDNAINSVYIWMGDKDSVVVPDAFYTTKSFNDYGWMEYVETLRYSNTVFTPCRTVGGAGGRKAVISGIWAIRPPTSQEEIRNFVVINFDRNKLEEKMSQSVSKYEKLFVLNSSKQEIMGNGQVLLEIIDEEEVLSYINHNTKGIYSGNGDYAAASTVSTYTDWTYLLFSEIKLPVLPDRRQILHLVRNLFIWAVIMFVLSISVYKHRISDDEVVMQRTEEEKERSFCVGEEGDETGLDWERRRYYINSARYNVIAGNLGNRQFEEARKGIEAIIQELREPIMQGRYYSNSKIALYMLLDIIIQTMKKCRCKPEAADKSFDEIYNEMNECCNLEEAAGLVMSTLEIYQRCVWKESEHGNYTNPVDIMLEYIDENYDKDISLKMFLEMTHFSESHLSRMFKNSTGENYRSYLMRKKIEASKNMLQESNMKVSEIAAALSFNDSKAFIRAFEKYEKVTPGKYRHNAGMKKEDTDACDREDTL